MLSTNIEKSANYIRIVNILKSMLKAGEINGKEYEKAQEIRQALDSGFKTKGGLTRIDKIGGLLDHFKEIQSAKQLGIRK